MVENLELIKKTIKKAISFYNNIQNELKDKPDDFNKPDIWRCEYAIKQLKYIEEMLNSNCTDAEKTLNIESAYKALNKGVEQFDNSQVNRQHIKFNNELYIYLFEDLP